MEKRMFPADKVSGAEVCLFSVSILSELIQKYHERKPLFPIPFYAITLDIPGSRMSEWSRIDEYEAQSRRILDHIQANGLEYFEKMADEMTRAADAFCRHSLPIARSIPGMSDRELVDAYAAYADLHTYNFSLGIITFLYEDTVSRWLVESLGKDHANPSEHLGALLKSPYRSFMVESESRLVEIRNETDTAKKDALVAKYIEDFYYMKASYLAAEVITPELVLDMAHKAHVTEDFVEKITVECSDEQRRVIDLLKITEVIHDQRKKSSVIGVYTSFAFLNEVVKRAHVDLDLAKRMFARELPQLLKDPSEILPKLRARTEASIIWADDTSYLLEYNAVTPRTLENGAVHECKGTPASRGTATGPARIILGESDFHKLQKGDVLIAEMTRPEFVPIMRLASAIVTDEGGLTCHAAVVAREMQKPCIVGTRTATSIFKDGDMVEVDAEKGIVRKI